MIKAAWGKEERNIKSQKKKREISIINKLEIHIHTD